MKSTAIYTRVSTTEQAESGNGLDVQLQRCEAQILAKGWSVFGVYSDDGISGTKAAADRAGLRELLDNACAGLFDAVVFLSLDRIGRNTRIVLDTIEKLTECNVEVVSVKESIDTSTPSGKFVLTIFAALAQLERDNIVERTTDGRNSRGKRDGEKGGKVPVGYKECSILAKLRVKLW